MATNTTTAARAEITARIAQIGFLMAVGSERAVDTARMGLGLLGSDIDHLIELAKAEGAREEASRLLDLQTESDALAAEQSR